MKKLIGSTFALMTALGVMIADSKPARAAIAETSAPIVSNPWVEVPDAGGSFGTFQPVVDGNSPYDGFTGFLGGIVSVLTLGTDAADVFGFSWAGGNFSAIGSFDEILIGSLGLYSVNLSLLDISGTVLQGPSSFISQPDLATGQYFLEVATGFLEDPPYTVHVTGPVDFPVLPFTMLPFQVPEPASLALFGLGLAGLGVMRRRKRA